MRLRVRAPDCPIDARVKAPVGPNVIDPNRPPAAQHFSGNATIGGEAQPSQAFGRLWIFVGDVGKEQLLRTGVLQQDADALRVQRLPAFRDHQATEILQFGARGKRAAELVQQSQPGTVVEQLADESATNRSGMLTTAAWTTSATVPGSFSTRSACCRARGWAATMLVALRRLGLGIVLITLVSSGATAFRSPTARNRAHEVLGRCTSSRW